MLFRSRTNANLYINGRHKDRISLLVIPPGYADYYHIEPPTDLSAFPKLRNCKTVYTWNIPIEFLRHDGRVVVEVRLDPGVYWDIDYVALIFNHV